MKYGLEKELFILKDNIIQMVPKNSNLPFDESGVLIEARGEPFDSIIKAIYSLRAEEHRIITLANKLGFATSDIPVMLITKDLRKKVRRNYTKGVTSFLNMYKYEDHRHKQNEVIAGIHISFTSPRMISYRERPSCTKIGLFKRPCCDYDQSREIIVNEFFDFIKYVKALDKAFKDEIKASKRNPGFYEVKYDGRVEYRSLPANVDLDKIIEVIQSVE